MVLMRPLNMIGRYLKTEAAGGQLLMASAALAMLVANSSLSEAYFETLALHIGPLSLLHWINDGLMALFFLLVGLEIKREMVEGEMARWPQRLLPGTAALGGMLVPALVYLAINRGIPDNLDGWAIPAATDIAFALGIVALLGSRVPVSLKLLLTAIAIIDDLGAILIIAIAYTDQLNLVALGAAAVLTGILATLNLRGVRSLWPYMLLGSALWVAVLMSGIHATLAGVVLAFTIPLRHHNGTHSSDHAPLLRLEHALAPLSAFFIVPVFGFANAGVALAGMTPADAVAPVPLGVALGLLLGKQVGVFGSIYLMVKSGFADAPARASWPQIWGLSLLCGIGFTMSLFIAGLAFGDGTHQNDAAKLGILSGSIIAALAGYLVLVRTTPKGSAPRH